jgi:hypothetical protein
MFSIMPFKYTISCQKSLFCVHPRAYAGPPMLRSHFTVVLFQRVRKSRLLRKMVQVGWAVVRPLCSSQKIVSMILAIVFTTQ